MKKSKTKKESESEIKMPYRVGQILFVILNKKMQIYPMMIIEEITKRTMQGVETNYVLQAGAESTSTVLLNQVDGEVFESADDARRVLIERATSQIDRLIQVATEKSSEWYIRQEPAPKAVVAAPTPVVDIDMVKVELPDGTVANLKK